MIDITFRAARFRRQLHRRRMKDRSRIPKYPVHTLVTPREPYGYRVGIVDKNTGSVLENTREITHVVFWDKDEDRSVMAQWNENDLRALTILERVWFPHPRKGYMMCGRTTGTAAILIHLAFAIGLTICITTWSSGGAYGLIPLVPMMLGFWRYTFRNITGKTV